MPFWTPSALTVHFTLVEEHVATAIIEVMRQWSWARNKESRGVVAVAVDSTEAAVLAGTMVVVVEMIDG